MDEKRTVGAVGPSLPPPCMEALMLLLAGSCSPVGLVFDEDLIGRLTKFVSRMSTRSRQLARTSSQSRFWMRDTRALCKKVDHH